MSSRGRMSYEENEHPADLSNLLCFFETLSNVTATNRRGAGGVPNSGNNSLGSIWGISIPDGYRGAHQRLLDSIENIETSDAYNCESDASYDLDDLVDNAKMRKVLKRTKHSKKSTKKTEKGSQKKKKDIQDDNLGNTDEYPDYVDLKGKQKEEENCSPPKNAKRRRSSVSEDSDSCASSKKSKTREAVVDNLESKTAQKQPIFRNFGKCEWARTNSRLIVPANDTRSTSAQIPSVDDDNLRVQEPVSLKTMCDQKPQPRKVYRPSAKMDHLIFG